MFLRPFTAVCEIKQASLSLRRLTSGNSARAAAGSLLLPGSFHLSVFYFLLLLGRGLFSGLFPLFILNGLCYNKEE